MAVEDDPPFMPTAMVAMGLWRAQAVSISIWKESDFLQSKLLESVA